MNQQWQGKSIREMAEAQGKGIIDGFLDLVVEEHLDTVFLEGSSNVDKEAMAQILNYPNAYIGLSDGGAHVQFHGGYGYSTRLLGYWVRQEGIMSLSTPVRRLDLSSRPPPSASMIGVCSVRAWRPTSQSSTPTPSTRCREDTVHDFPAGGWRIRELAQGIHYTVVNGQVLLEDGRHTGALPAASCGHPVPRDGQSLSLRIPQFPLSLARERGLWACVRLAIAGTHQV